jgi:hypothetical protein
MLAPMPVPRAAVAAFLTEAPVLLAAATAPPVPPIAVFVLANYAEPATVRTTFA